MSDLFELSIEKRNVFGKGQIRRLRRLDKKVPAIVYGAGKPSQAIAVTHRQLDKALQNEAFYSHILTLKLDGVEEKVVLKDLQRHPSKPLIMHADFLRVNATEKITMHVALHFINEDTAPGVKLQNGVISHAASEIEIRCLPADLPEYIEVDLSNLGMDGAIHLSDLKLPKGVESVALAHHDDRLLVSIHKLVVIEESEEPLIIPAAEVPVVGKEGAAAEKEEEKDGKK